MLTFAFAADPVERWLYPEAQDYLSYFPGFLAALGGRVFAVSTCRGSPPTPPCRVGASAAS
jgi:hypothetical protein